MDSEIWLVSIALITLFFLILLWRMHRRHRSDLRKVQFLFNAADNLDFAFRFPEKGKGRAFHMALNRMKGFMETAHVRLKENERYYEQILSVVSTAILVTDPQGRVLLSNQAAQKLLRREFITHISQVEAELRPDRLAVRRTPIVLHGKQATLWAISDIASELDQQEMLSWEKLIRVLTHEIMNGVAPITSLSRSLLDRSSVAGELSPQALRQGLQTIHDTSGHLLRFVESYRSLTLLPQPVPAPFYVKPFLDRQLLAAKAFCTDAVPQMQLRVTPPDLMLYTDESLLTRVITNLLKNAVESIAETGQTDGCIILEADTDEAENVRISVSNNGAPIPEEVAANIFVPFFTTKPGGSGIGLSLSARIMQTCGGRISLQESTAGRTTFLLTFAG